MDLTSRGRWIWLSLLLLSPLAYLAGVLLLARDPAVHYSIDRQDARSLSSRFASQKGVSTEGWTTYIMGFGRTRLQTYYRRHDSPIEAALQSLVPSHSAKVVHIYYPDDQESEEQRHFETEVGPDGQVLGYEYTLAQHEGEEGVSDQTSLGIAQQALGRRMAAIPELEFEEPEIESDQQDGSLIRTYTWKGSPAAATEMKLTVEVTVQRGVVISERVDAKVDADFLPPRVGNANLGQIILGGLLGISWLLLGIFGFVRYVRRSRQKELSHKRTLAVGLVVGAVYVAATFLNALDIIGFQQKEAPWWVPWLSLAAGALVNLITAFLLGLAWGSGEGDVREAFQGKLTSLDALMTGKVFSRNVSLASVTGIALAGWLVLSNGVFNLIGGATAAAESLAVISFFPLPGLYVLLAPFERSVPFAIFGLLLPLAFAYRCFGSRRWRGIFLAASSIAACSWVGLASEIPWAGFLQVLTIAASLLAIFFAFDFLTAAAALNAFWIASNLVQFPVDSAVTWGVFSLAGAIMMPLLGLQAYFAWRGRHYQQEEVRPLYAAHVAERQALQAEVSAARQAQLRLGPQAVPNLAGLSVAASCQPAREVGGDFYDFFSIDRDRLGIFLAEGGGEGLSAALAVAYAKGLLMPMVASATPSKVMARLEESLQPLLRKATSLGLLYALVDISKGSLNYARMGEYPRMLVNRNPASPSAHESRPDPSANWLQGSFELQPGDRILLFTDGIAQTLSLAEDSPEEWLQQFLSSRREGTAEQTLDAFLKALQSRVQRAKRQGLEDDLSSILLQLSSQAIFGQQVVTPKEEVA